MKRQCDSCKDYFEDDQQGLTEFQKGWGMGILTGIIFYLITLWVF